MSKKVAMMQCTLFYSVAIFSLSQSEKEKKGVILCSIILENLEK
jgi:hypothetical protein